MSMFLTERVFDIVMRIYWTHIILLFFPYSFFFSPITNIYYLYAGSIHVLLHFCQAIVNAPLSACVYSYLFGNPANGTSRTLSRFLFLETHLASRISFSSRIRVLTLSRVDLIESGGLYGLAPAALLEFPKQLLAAARVFQIIHTAHPVASRHNPSFGQVRGSNAYQSSCIGSYSATSRVCKGLARSTLQSCRIWARHVNILPLNWPYVSLWT